MRNNYYGIRLALQKLAIDIKIKLKIVIEN
jgi:hypothetical protein